MDLLSLFLDFALNVDKYLGVFAQALGNWTYLLLFLIVFSGPVFAANRILITPSSLSGSPASTIDVVVTAEAISNFYAYQFDINYNPAVLQFSTITYSPLIF